jgi:hypothetical protein
MAGEGCSWVAAVGFPTIGLVAAAEMGIPLDRLALVAQPGERWQPVVASLLDGVDLVLLSPPARVASSDARRLVARTRERGSVLVLVDPDGRIEWPESPDVRLDVESATWRGLGAGHGNLREREMKVVLGGRRLAGGRSRRVTIWLPGSDGVVEARSVGIAPTGVEPTEIEPTEIEPTEFEPTEIGQGGIGERSDRLDRPLVAAAG